MRGVALSVIGRMTDVGQGANAGNPFSTKTLAHLLLLGRPWRRSSGTRGLPLIPDMDEQVLEEFLHPMGITARRPAADIDVPPIRTATWSTAGDRWRPIPRCGSACSFRSTPDLGWTGRLSTTCVWPAGGCRRNWLSGCGSSEGDLLGGLLCGVNSFSLCSVLRRC